MSDNEIFSDSDDDVEEQQTTPDAFITCRERFDQHKLYTILQNQKEIAKQMRPITDPTYKPFLLLQRYLDNSEDGVATVTYRQNNSYGRYFAQGSLSLQSFPREIRHTIAGEYYQDIDIVNAHPVILQHLCKGKVDTPALTDYNNNREDLLQKISSNRERAKEVVLSMLNGGESQYQKYKNKVPMLRELKKEIKAIYKVLCAGNKYHLHLQTYSGNNSKGSFINKLLCDFENKILQLMRESWRGSQYEVMCFDGGMINFEVKVDVPELEGRIKDTLGITVQLKIKPMDEGLKLPTIEHYGYYFQDLRSVITAHPFDVDKVKTVLKHSCISISNNGNEFIATRNRTEGGLEYNILDRDKVLTRDRTITYKFTNSEGKEVEVKTTINVLYDNHIRFQYMYDSVEFLPYLVKPPQSKNNLKIFNTFPGYRWAYRKIAYEMDEKTGIPVPPTSIKPWVDHLINTLAPNNQLIEMNDLHVNNSDRHLGKIVLQWYAHMFKHPKQKPYALVLKSSEGVGKGLWGDFIYNIISKRYCGTFVSWEQLAGSFNGRLSDKILITLNEATNYPTNQQKEFIKTLIKDTDLEINRKFQNQYNTENYARVMITTNNTRPVVIDKNDRRYLCIECNNDNKCNAEYFDPLIKSKDSEEVQRAMFDYLTNFPLDDFDAERPPMTLWKQDLIASSTSPEVEFVKEFIEEEHPNCEYQGDCIKARVKDMYSYYETYISESGEFSKQKKKDFKLTLKNMGIECEKMRFAGDRFWGFKIDKNKLKL
jgi:hypothetical protein